MGSRKNRMPSPVNVRSVSVEQVNIAIKQNEIVGDEVDDLDNESLIIVICKTILLLLAALVNYILVGLSSVVKYLFYKKKSNKIGARESLAMMSSSKTYNEWRTAAHSLDIALGKDLWRTQKESEFYDYKLIEHRLNNFRTLAHKGNIHGLLSAIQESMVRNLGGIGNRVLYEQTSGCDTKQLISEYIEEVCRQLNFLHRTEIEGFPLEKKLNYFYELRQSYGRSALLLSGGASLGMYHLGVVRALHGENLVPKVVSGSSVGSIAATFLCAITDEEMPTLFEMDRWNLNVFEHSGSFRRKLLRLLTKGVLMDSKKLKAWLRKNFGDMTFKEAFEKTGKILNIAVSSTETFEIPRLLNYLTTPNVLLWSAVCASCALPFVFEPVELMAKDKEGKIVSFHPPGQKWTDGSVSADVPMTRIAELFNVNHFIVSQVNPHVAPFLSMTESAKGFWYSLFYLFKSELKHRVLQVTDLGLVPSYLNRLKPIVTQKYSGDITIVPQLTSSDILRILSNPDSALMDEYMSKGEKITWPKISNIRNQCAVELTLERILIDLRKEIHRRNMNQNFESPMKKL